MAFVNSNSKARTYDPKALLNPKAHVQPENTSASSSARSNKSSIPMDNSQHAMDSQSETNVATDHNMGSMLERMHNIGDRDAQPLKKRKIEHASASDGEDDTDQEDLRKKSAFTSGKSNGQLAQYLKNQKPEDAATNGPPDPEVVDLMSDDEEVVVVREKADREVCLGRIDNARVNAHKIPSPKSSGLQGLRNQWPPMKVELFRPAGSSTQIIRVHDPMGIDFGTIDVRTASALVPIMDSSQSNVRIQARLLTRPRQPWEHQQQLTSESYPLVINVYAPRSRVSGIGKFFGQKLVFFKQPLSVDRGVEVCNPHAPKDRNSKPTALAASTSRYTNGGSTTYAVRTTDQVKQDVLNVFDSLQRSDELPEQDTPEALSTPLLPHQKQALHFMLGRENLPDDADEDTKALWKVNYRANGTKIWYNVISGHETKRMPTPTLGGILADVMGLGKTLNILALLVATMPQAKAWSEQPPPEQREGEPELILNAKGTLLVCPVSTITNWEDQIKLHIKPKTIKCYVYHGSNRVRDVEQLKDYDLIITSYSCVSSDFDKRSRKNLEPPLEKINWFRIVLDEAHVIRQQNTRQSQATCALVAQRRWAVTGTPVQNRLEDLGALVKFLRMKPFDEPAGFNRFFIGPLKAAEADVLPKLRLLVDSITLRRLKDKLNLPKRIEMITKLKFSDSERALYDWFKLDSKSKVKAMTEGGKKGLGGKGYAQVLRALLRMRLLCAHGQELLSDEDMELTKGIDISNAIDLEDDDDERPPVTSKQACEMHHIMREANADFCPKCNTRIGIKDARSSEDSSDESSGEESSNDDEVLGYLTPCNHIICPNCIEGYKKDLQNGATVDNHNFCTICGTYIRISTYEITQSEVTAAEASRNELRTNVTLAKQLSRYSEPHTKTKALVQALLENAAWSREHPEEAPIKSVVFSGWTAHLNLIQIALTEAGIEFTRLDGSMSRSHRSAALNTFATSKTVCCFLISLTAGGLGLNLTAASRVFVMEPQWNPAAEAQAVERVHRLGQTRDVEITKFIMEDSVEEHIVSIQKRKLKLANLSIERIDKQQMAMQKLEDLRALFA